MNETVQNLVIKQSLFSNDCKTHTKRWAFRSSLIILLFLFTTIAHSQNTLQDIKFASLPNDQVQLSFQFSSTPTEPLAFTIDNPARIALDFLGTNTELENRFQEIGVGVAQSVNAAEAKGRTRVVIN